MDPALLLLILLSLAFSFFFSGIEIAFLSANKLQLELQAKQGSISGKIFSKFIKKPSLFIGTTLIGNTIALVLYGIFMAQLLEPRLQLWLPDPFQNEVTILIIQTLAATILVLVTAEFLPKSLFLINPNLMLTALAVPFNILYYFLFPLVISIVSLSKFVITKIFRTEYSDEKPVFGLTDLNHYLKNMLRVKHEDEDIELDKKIFHNALEFKSVRVRECMIPRTEIIAVEIQDGMEKLRKAFVESGHSKILIYKDSIDDVIGYCHSSELFKKPTRIEDILTPIIIVPETILANELMIRFINERKSLALVVDEFGGTSGLVSMEDVIEEIFGEIEDEHDEDDLVEQQLDKHTWLLSARLEIDYLNDTYNWNLPTGEYETLGGLILSYREDLPQPGETISIPPYSFTVQSTLDNRIDTLRITVANGSD
ncbi:MAG: HlyC/CorC family transporter [Cyclobacteriaceae bacterium]|nr:HlyC/CorC family transporter [Cyclobacteriaceae bacterium]UYN86506.1 MAG: HlyC/CorC family transporter [Cyclobacteriaceae bacterium]